MSTKILPSSQISLISSVVKCRCCCIRPPCWNIPPITNLYPVADPSKPIPLSKLKLEGSIHNSSASLSFVQTFKNEFKNPVECIYKFPSDYTFAVVGLSVTVGDKTIETEIMEKKQAEQKYDDAVAAGHTAVKLNYDERLPDIIELNIGQLQPGDTAKITVKMVAELEVFKHGFFSFVFPLDFFPRYGAEQGLLGETGKLLPAEFEADITLKSSSIITNLDVSHKGFVFEQSEDGCEVRLNLGPSKDIAAKDIVISYSTEQIREPQLVLTRCDKYPGEVAAHISYIPRSSEEHEVDEDEESKESEKTLTEVEDNDDPDVANGEFIFILDRSWSMGGTRIKVAKDALQLFIRSIPPNSKFNIVSFGSKYESMYPNSIEYNNENMQYALDKISRFEADFGGTELFEPCEHVLSQPNDVKCPKNVFILTDGDISYTERVLDEIRKSNHQTRVHSFGIGSGASVYLVKEIAKEGRGSSTLVADEDPNLKAKVIKTLKLASKSAFTGLTANWNLNSECIRFYVPQFPLIPYIYEEEPFHLYTILSEDQLCESTVDLSFYNTLEADSQTISIKVDPAQIQNSIHGQEFELAAKHYIDHLSRLTKADKKPRDSEIVEVSVKYRVLSNKTAFFGKIKNSAVSTEEMKTIEIPIKNLKLYEEDSSSEKNSRMHGMFSMPKMSCEPEIIEMFDLDCCEFEMPKMTKMPNLLRCMPEKTRVKSSTGKPKQCKSKNARSRTEDKCNEFIDKKTKSRPDLQEKESKIRPAKNIEEGMEKKKERQKGRMKKDKMEVMEERDESVQWDMERRDRNRNEITKNKKSIAKDEPKGFLSVACNQDAKGFFHQLPSTFLYLAGTPVPRTIIEAVSDPDDEHKVWMTILSICILIKHFKDFQAEWTMISKKAEAYLKKMNVKNFKQEIQNALRLV